MAVDIVIPFVHSHNGDRELKWSVRGFRKFLKGLRSIYIIGERPRSKEVSDYIYLPFSQASYAYEWKERSIYDKLKQACYISEVSDPFLYANDDHFLLRPVEASQFPYYHSGVKITSTVAGSYAETIRNTRRLLGENYTNFDVHTPILIHKEPFISTFSHVNWKVRYGYCIKSVYMSRVIDGREYRYTDDCKLVRREMTSQEIREAIRGRELFSIGEHCMGGGMEEVLAELYSQTPAI
jgi:hypothetical protein